MTVGKPIAKKLLRPIKTGAKSVINQSEFRAVTSNLFKEWGKSRIEGAIVSSFAPYCLETWREILNQSLIVAITTP